MGGRTAVRRPDLGRFVGPGAGPAARNRVEPVLTYPVRREAGLPLFA
ncbi:hypothetical protein [Streptomyces sp. NPDC051776]